MPYINVRMTAPLTPEKESALTALTGELMRAEQAVDLMEFTDPSLENIIKNIIYLGLPARAEKAAEGKQTGKKG